MMIISGRNLGHRYWQHGCFEVLAAFISTALYFSHIYQTGHCQKTETVSSQMQYDSENCLFEVCIGVYS